MRAFFAKGSVAPPEGPRTAPAGISPDLQLTSASFGLGTTRQVHRSPLQKAPKMSPIGYVHLRVLHQPIVIYRNFKNRTIARLPGGTDAANDITGLSTDREGQETSLPAEAVGEIIVLE